MIGNFIVDLIPNTFVTMLAIWLFIVPIALVLYIVYSSVKMYEAISWWIWNFVNQTNEQNQKRG
ncbi:MAG: hypothetical protein CVV36_04645 [Candidatus Methanoperedenaceae archaeon HGW-Methanoperedenaceae-1]|jgi:hypothetical protein|nr:MAG: hypothetical protein CVV36_04645 [Candidatus Methanoperedenaceae archaeon HGW-Methanoperedenaceae-1]